MKPHTVCGLVVASFGVCSLASGDLLVAACLLLVAAWIAFADPEAEV